MTEKILQLDNSLMLAIMASDVAC